MSLLQKALSNLSDWKKVHRKAIFKEIDEKIIVASSEGKVGIAYNPSHADERVISTEEIISNYEKQGFDVKIYEGRYDRITIYIYWV